MKKQFKNILKDNIALATLVLTKIDLAFPSVIHFETQTLIKILFFPKQFSANCLMKLPFHFMIFK